MFQTNDQTSAAFQQWVATRRPPVIMQILPALNSGGVEQSVIDINAAIVRAGGRSIVVSSGGVRAYEITRAGGQHIQLPVQSKNPIVMAANVRRLRRIIREAGVDIVHACSRAPAWSAARAVQGTAARYVTSCHAAHKVGNALKRAYNASVAGGERVIAVSNFLAEYLEQNYRVDPEVIRVVHRGVALEKFHPNLVTPERMVSLSQQWRLPEGASIILLPARITRIKGHGLLLDAVAQLHRDDIFCVFVGSDTGKENYRKALEKQIMDRGMGGKVRIVPACSDMPAAYMLSAVVVCPSLVPEGFGRVPAEAQAMGRPVIATDHGGCAKPLCATKPAGWCSPVTRRIWLRP